MQTFRRAELFFAWPVNFLIGRMNVAGVELMGMNGGCCIINPKAMSADVPGSGRLCYGRRKVTCRRDNKTQLEGCEKAFWARVEVTGWGDLGSCFAIRYLLKFQEWRGDEHANWYSEKTWVILRFVYERHFRGLRRRARISGGWLGRPSEVETSFSYIFSPTISSHLRSCVREAAVVWSEVLTDGGILPGNNWRSFHSESSDALIIEQDSETFIRHMVQKIQGTKRKSHWAPQFVVWMTVAFQRKIFWIFDGASCPHLRFRCVDFFLAKSFLRKKRPPGASRFALVDLVSKTPSYRARARK